MMMNRSTFHRLFWLLIVLSCMPSGPARAAEGITVTAISAPDTRGLWRPVKQSAAAAKVIGDERTPLRVGMPVEVGDRLVTEQARVTLRIGRAEHLTVQPGTDMVVRERSVLQQMGSIYYQVRDAFTVQYGTVQTAVEGTEFVVGGTPDAVEVTVTEGVVRVENSGVDVRLRRGQRVATVGDGAPSEPVRIPSAVVQRLRQQAWTLARPRIRLGALATGGISNAEGSASIRYFGSVRLLPFIDLVADAEHGMTPSRLRTGSGIGLEWVLGGLRLGATAAMTLEQWQYDCGGRYAALQLGGAAYGRYNIDISRKVFVTGMARAAAIGAGVEATMGLGAGVSL